MIDVCTPSQTHFDLAWGALEAGKYVPCEKPVAYDFRDTRRAAVFARLKGLKTTLGFTFRYAPSIEARLYGSKGALTCRLVEEEGICERLWAATPDQVEFRDLTVPDRFYPPGGSRTESWPCRSPDAGRGA